MVNQLDIHIAPKPRLERLHGNLDPARRFRTLPGISGEAAKQTRRMLHIVSREAAP